MTLFICRACGWKQGEETDDLTCARCGEGREWVESVEVEVVYRLRNEEP